MTVEIVGLPGSGKTTLLNTLKNNNITFYTYEEIHNFYFSNLTIPKILSKVFKKTPKFVNYFSILFIFELLRAYKRSYRNIRSIKTLIKKRIPTKSNNRKFIKQITRRTLLQYIFSNKYKTKLLIYDEGEFQLLLTFLNDELSIKLNKINTNKVIAIDVSPETALNRMLLRPEGLPWEKKIYLETPLELLEKRKKNLEIIIAILQQKHVEHCLITDVLTIPQCLLKLLQNSN